LPNWFYVREGQRVGPIDEAEFQSLVNAGAITSETFVWNEGMADWKRYGDAGAQRKGAYAPAAPAYQATGIGQYSCIECGNPFLAEEMVQYGNSWVCATCKPVFFQRLKEGAPLRTAMVYGGFWIRFGAKIIDSIILGMVNGAIQVILRLALGGFEQEEAVNPAFFVFLGLIWFAQIAVAATYTTWFLGKFAATPGKMACGLKVVMPDGGRVSYMRAFGRHFAEMLSGLILAIGYIIAAFDEEKRTLHDRICDTRVIRK
jgi:uncharacterized RDD family membrane protein YckC